MATIGHLIVDLLHGYCCILSFLDQNFLHNSHTAEPSLLLLVRLSGEGEEAENEDRLISMAASPVFARRHSSSPAYEAMYPSSRPYTPGTRLHIL